MRLFLLTALTMVAFAANSVLNRMALAGEEAGPAAFAAVRLVSGAIALAVLVWIKSGRPQLFGPGRVTGVWSLTLYILGFSFAYIWLDAGLGALILFGMVQMTMFAGALIAREPISAARWAGAGIAMAGLAYLLWPTGTTAPPALGAILMAAAGFGWGVYSLNGRGVSDPLGATAANFILAAPFTVLVVAVITDGMSFPGFLLACLSGIVTSGLGYALWYTVLPKLAASVAAVAQLTVPVIAVAGGVALLGEAPSLRLVVASVLVLGGVAISVLWPSKRA